MEIIASNHDLVEVAQHYRPDNSLASYIGDKVIVPVVGPSGIGKNTIMDEACRQSDSSNDLPSFRRVQSFTTRPQRPGEPGDTYRFLPHNRETIHDLGAKMRDHQLVQIAVHATTGYVYGSEPCDYPGEYNLIDMLADQVDSIRKLPFGYCVTIALAAKPEVWADWFSHRYNGHIGTEEPQQRLREAAKSLSHSLKDIDTMWLENYADQQEVVGTKLVGMARGDLGSENAAYNYAREMLGQARLMQNRAKQLSA